MPDSIDFTLGLLSQAVKDLAGEVAGLRGDVANLRFDLNEIRLFRAKVVGASLAVSVMASAILTLLERTWAR